MDELFALVESGANMPPDEWWHSNTELIERELYKLVVTRLKELPPTVAVLCAEYAAECHFWLSPETAKYDCIDATDGFVAACKAAEVSVEVVDFLCEKYKRNGFMTMVIAHEVSINLSEEAHHLPLPELPHHFAGATIGHTVARVDGWYIDFTARQFDAAAPFPLVWR